MLFRVSQWMQIEKLTVCHTTNLTLYFDIKGDHFSVIFHIFKVLHLSVLNPDHFHYSRKKTLYPLTNHSFVLLPKYPLTYLSSNLFQNIDPILLICMSVLYIGAILL